MVISLNLLIAQQLTVLFNIDWSKHILCTRSCLLTGHISGRTASVRDQLTGTLYNTNPVSVPAATNAPPPRTLFGRLGIRKPSLLSLSGPLVPPHAAHTARTFSLDDLLKPPVRSKKCPVPFFTVLGPGLVHVHPSLHCTITPLLFYFIFVQHNYILNVCFNYLQLLSL